MLLPVEFAFIHRHFRALAGPGSLDLSDDAALLDPPAGLTLVLAADAAVEGVHFLPGDPPGAVSRKLLRRNLSDLAAMGADPLGYLLCAGFRRGAPEAEVAAFAAGLAADQALFGLSALGGDTTSVPGPACHSLTVLGTVPPGRALLRAGARAGDDLWVSGTVGDGALGLLVLRDGTVADPDGVLADRYRLPQPRLALGRALRGVARAAMDVSDGLVQDAAHLCRAAGLAAVIEAVRVPLSAPARAALATDPALLPRLLSGGDDYELIFAADPADAEAVAAASRLAGVAATRIGTFQPGPPAVTVLGADGAPVALAAEGWSHF